MRFFIFLFLSILFINATDLSKEAFNAYKNKNYKKAYNLWDKACKKDDFKSCNNEAMLVYLKAVDLNLDQSKAIRILENVLKKDKNNTKVMFNLGMMYYNGYFDKKLKKAFIKRKEALEIFEKCMKLGNEDCKKEYKFITSSYDANQTKK